MLLTIAQPDHETTDQRIRGRIVRMFRKKFSLRTQRGNSQPKFFKPYRRSAGVVAKTKELFITKTYAWRSRRYSNRRSVYSKTPFEISAEFRRRKREWPTEKNSRTSCQHRRCTPLQPFSACTLIPRRGHARSRRGIPVPWCLWLDTVEMMLPVAILRSHNRAGRPRCSRFAWWF
jgi:hypothetical protein